MKLDRALDAETDTFLANAKARSAAKAQSVVLAWVTPGQVNARFMDSILKLHSADVQRPIGQQRLYRKGSGYHYLVSGPRIASARNELVRRFLSDKFDAEWLWMIDTDMVFEPDILDRLLEVADPKERPVVGALCFGGGKGQLFPTMYVLQDPKEHNGALHDYVREWEPGSLVKVDATGAACILMHRSVLKAMGERYPEPAPWYSESIYKGVEFGEDFSFCLRLLQMEIPLYVNTAASIGHEKPVVLDETVWRNMTLNLSAEGKPIKEAELAPKLEVAKSELIVVGG